MLQNEQVTNGTLPIRPNGPYPPVLMRRSRKRGRPAEADKPIKIQLDLINSPYASVAKLLKGQLLEESDLEDISLSEYVVRVLLSMSQAERIQRARSGGILPKEETTR